MYHYASFLAQLKCGSSLLAIAIATPAKAKKGDAMDAANVSKMLGLLKYQRDKAKPGEKKDDAIEALKVYQTLSEADERKKFLEAFEANGSGLQKSSLKFALTFKQSLKSNKVTEVSSVEDYITRLSC